MNISTVNELIQSLESAGELSIREQKFLKLAKAFKHLAAENVALKSAVDHTIEWIESTNGDPCDVVILKGIRTPATDRIVAGIKADGVEEFIGLLQQHVDEVTALRRRIAELESRTVKLPAELYTIGELIRTQDNRITDQPMFVVFQKREIIGSDEHSPSRICWVWDGEEVSELRAKRLEALYQDGRDTRGYDRYAMQEVDEFVTACFTEHGCKDYLRQNGHNLRLPYIYACGSFRNNEYQLVRNWLAGIKVEAE